jgi:hypothetical protein
MERHFRVLWSRGLRTAFTSKTATLHRVPEALFPKGRKDSTVRIAVEGALHTEYEIRAVRQLIQANFFGKRRMLLTGIIDLVVQQQNPLQYSRVWSWTSRDDLEGKVTETVLKARENDLEVWDYKGSRAGTPYKTDYVRQLLTYAALYRERTGVLPSRCVLFFVNERSKPDQLVVVLIDEDIIERSLKWTIHQVRELRKTAIKFEQDPTSVDGGSLHLLTRPVGQRVDGELKKQCTACGLRFDCSEYIAHLSRTNHPDVRLDNVSKN